jgi:hypothetical protein
MSRFYPVESSREGMPVAHATVHDELMSNYAAMELHQHWTDRRRAGCIAGGTSFAAEQATDAFVLASREFCSAHFMVSNAIRDVGGTAMKQ